jgi:molybdate transport system ATP-binding protein
VDFELRLERRLGTTTVSLDLQADAGITVLSGPSGAGKTSVLNMVAGLLRPDAGHVRVAGQTLFDAVAGIDVPPERRRAGYVFQDARLFPHLRVRDNLRFGYRLADAARRWLAPGQAIELLGIEHLLDRWPASLSGGEARRVAIGRALLSGARFLLLDEPLSFVDRTRREEILGLIERIRDELRLPMLYVTHDAEEAQRLATRIVAL